MAVPRNRVSNSKKNSRRAHHARKAAHLTNCANCGNAVPRHRVCSSCGFYGARSVIQSKDD